MKDEASSLADPVAGEFGGLVMDQDRHSVGFGNVNDLLDGGLVDLFVVHVGDAELDAHVVGADEDAVDPGDGQELLELLDGDDALNADDGDVVPVAVVKVAPGRLAGDVASVDDAAGGLTLQGRAWLPRRRS